MAAGSTYSTIATTTLGSNASSYTFSSIPSTYTDLVLVASVACLANDNTVSIKFNGDTGSNYSGTELRGTGSSAVSSRNSSITYMPVAKDACPTTTLGEHNLVINVMNYSNSTTYKTVLSRANTPVSQTYTGAESFVGLWRSTSAITSIAVSVSGSFITGSTFTLYGIAAA